MATDEEGNAWVGILARECNQGAPPTDRCHAAIMLVQVYLSGKGWTATPKAWNLFTVNDE